MLPKRIARSTVANPERVLLADADKTRHEVAVHMIILSPKVIQIPLENGQVQQSRMVA